MLIENAASFAPAGAAAPEASLFTSLQWLVIAIGARRDTVPLPCSAFGRALLSLIGTEPQTSPCLETLRQTTSNARRFGWSIPAIEVGRFLRAGWSEDQLECLIESVSEQALCKNEWLLFDLGHGAVRDEDRSELRTKIMEFYA